MCRRALVSMLLLLGALPTARAQERGAPASEPWKSAARKLQQATATVRIWNQNEDPSAKPTAVTVCTGLCVRDGLIVTAAIAGTDSPIRLTCVGGTQAD